MQTAGRLIAFFDIANTSRIVLAEFIDATPPCSLPRTHLVWYACMTATSALPCLIERRQLLVSYRVFVMSLLPLLILDASSKQDEVAIMHRSNQASVMHMLYEQSHIHTLVQTYMTLAVQHTKM